MRSRSGQPGLLRRLGVVAAALTVIGGAGLVAAVAPAAPAYAAPCVGEGCNGKNPNIGCITTDHRTITRFSRTINGMYSYQLKYSTICRATWGHFIRDDCNYPSPLHHWLKVETQLQTPYGWYDFRTQIADMWNRTSNCNGGTAWTNMAPAHGGTRARLCFGTSSSSAQPSSWTCSGYYNGGVP